MLNEPLLAALGEILPPSALLTAGEDTRPYECDGLTLFRVQPLAIEFWQDRPFRLHERLKFERPDLLAQWAQTRLFP